MRVDGRHYRTVWMERDRLFMVEQNSLPFRFEIHSPKNHLETAHAIKTMIVRGAGAIGATGGFGMAQAFLEEADIEGARSLLASTRPTAQNLFYAIERVYKKGLEGGKEAAAAEAQAIADEDVAFCKKIGEHGEALIKDGMKILTHCNAGWLAFVDYGSATAPIYLAKDKDPFVWVDETRPRSQGARLTAWELKNESVPHRIIADNAAASLLARGDVDMVIVGCDRVAANGDVANKIGTLDRAILAKEFGIPFYVAAPLSTIDFACPSGSQIPIEERSQEEVLYQTGPTRDGRTERIQVTSPGSEAYNPAFDVTPARLITGLITPAGVVRPQDVAKLKPKAIA